MRVGFQAFSPYPMRLRKKQSGYTRHCVTNGLKISLAIKCNKTKSIWGSPDTH